MRVGSLPAWWTLYLSTPGIRHNPNTTMQLEMTYPDTPGFKTGGASREAAEAIADKVPTLRERVLDAYHEYGPMTADECAEVLGELFISVRPRVSELHRMGLLTKTDRMKVGPWGSNQHLFES